MSDCQIRFKYEQKDVVIPCSRNEQLKVIINRFGTKAGLSVDEFYFLYDGNDIKDLNKTFVQINDKSKEIILLVYSKNNSRENKLIKESKIIKCPECENPAIIEFTNDYKINLLDGKHDVKKIKLQDYINTQIVDQKKIKCCECSNTLAESYQFKFYYCFECHKNFCPMCQSKHKEHSNIVDYLIKDFRCEQHHGQSLSSYCLNCKKNLCLFCISNDQHKDHNIINFFNLVQEQKKTIEHIDRIEKVKKIVEDIIHLLSKFKDNLDIYVKINSKLNENLSNINMNYEILRSIQNLIETEFLKKDIDYIINNNDINKRFKKIISIYDMMNGAEVDNVINSNYDDETAKIKNKKNSENDNEITLKVKVDQNDVNKITYFLDNTQENFNNGKGYNENNNYVKHNHDNLSELNESNTILVINGGITPFKKSFIPKKSGIYSIKLIFKNKLSNCAYMFCQCKNIVDINISKFSTENVINMRCMFACCSQLKSLDLNSFKTGKTTIMDSMFYGCESLTSLNLKSFNTQQVTNMAAMFGDCFSLKTINLSSFNTQNVIIMLKCSITALH